HSEHPPVQLATGAAAGMFGAAEKLVFLNAALLVAHHLALVGEVFALRPNQTFGIVAPLVHHIVDGLGHLLDTAALDEAHGDLPFGQRRKVVAGSPYGLGVVLFAPGEGQYPLDQLLIDLCYMETQPDPTLDREAA